MPLKTFTGVNNILVIKLRHIGDVLLTVPAIRALKESFPGARVSALVNSGTEAMLTGNPLLHEVIPYDRALKNVSVAGRMTIELKFLGELRKRRFDMAVDLTGGDRPALIGFMCGARYRLGYDPAGSGFAGKKLLYTHMAKRPAARMHTVFRDAGVLWEFGITTADYTVDIHTSKEDDAAVDTLLGASGITPGTPFVHAHPTSRWMFKCWTDAAMADVLDRFESHGIRTVITAGPDGKELAKVRAIKSMMRHAPADLSARLTLKQLAALSKRSVLFFGVDTAPMHIAAAAGARVVSLFGPSGAFDWGPWDNSEIIEKGADYSASVEAGCAYSPYPLKNGLQRFGKNTVIQKDWDCVPCGKDGCNGSKKSDCLDAIDADFVWNIIKEIIPPRPAAAH